MSNLSSVLNEQIRRLARREAGRQARGARKQSAQHRRDIAALKREVASLRRALSDLERRQQRRPAAEPAPERVVTMKPLPPLREVKDSESIRFRADGLRTHRAKLGLSARDYGRLVGVSGLTIYHWEAGKAKPRRQQLAKLVAVRGMGKREANARLGMME